MGAQREKTEKRCLMAETHVRRQPRILGAATANEIRDQAYYDLLAYVVSNAVAGEIMAIDNYTNMVPLIEDTDGKIETVKQASDEAKHVRLLGKLGERLDFAVIRRIVLPQWLAIRDYVTQAAERGDLASCLIAQDLMVETLAVVLYRTLGRNTDLRTKKVAGTILDDEMGHLQIGIDRIKAMLDKDPEHVHECLTRTHDRVMPELFSMIGLEGHALACELGVDCATLRLDCVKTDLDAIRIEALDTYLEILDRVGFDVTITTPLLAKLSEYGERPWAQETFGSAAE